MKKRFRCIGALIPKKMKCGTVTPCYVLEEDHVSNSIAENVYVSSCRGFKLSKVEEKIFFHGMDCPSITEGKKVYHAFYAEELNGVPHLLIHQCQYGLFQQVLKLSKKYAFGHEIYEWLDENRYISCYELMQEKVIIDFLKNKKWNVNSLREENRYVYWNEVIMPLYDSYDRQYFYLEDDFGGQYLAILGVDMTLHIHSVRVIDGLKSLKQANGDPYLKVNRSMFFALKHQDAWATYLEKKFGLR